MFSLIKQEKQQQQHLFGFCSLVHILDGLGIVSSDYYRWERSQQVRDARLEKDKQLKGLIEGILEEFPTYGTRRTTASLRRLGHRVNRKHVKRIMRQHGLLCKRKRRFVNTTDSNHSLKVYPNLAKGLELHDINELWHADITYVGLSSCFIYVAAIIDGYSRCCVGWSIERNLTADLSIHALEKALSVRDVKQGLIHHSDRGVQYACHAYTNLLTAHGIQISMSRRGNPYDNAKAESFMKTLKVEEVYLMEYRDEEDAKLHIEHFLRDVYNKKRLHSSLGYVPPNEFEANLKAQSQTNQVVDLDKKIA